jgi:hypothetical protein
MEPAVAAECARFTFGREHDAASGVDAADRVAAVIEALR